MWDTRNPADIRPCYWLCSSGFPCYTCCKLFIVLLRHLIKLPDWWSHFHKVWTKLSRVLRHLCGSSDRCLWRPLINRLEIWLRYKICNFNLVFPLFLHIHISITKRCVCLVAYFTCDECASVLLFFLFVSASFDLNLFLRTVSFADSEKFQ